MSENQFVFDVDPQSFQTDVIGRSRDVPVVLLFWAEQVGPARDTRDMLARLVDQYQGKVVLALVDVARDQTLAQHLRVQGLPSLRVVRDGQLVDQIEGPQPEEVLREMLDELTMSPADVLREQLKSMLEQGAHDQALALLTQALREEPKNHSFRVELADILVLKGDLDAARAQLAEIPDDTAERERPQHRLEFAEEAAGMSSAADLKKSLAADPDSLDLRYQLAVALAHEGAYEPALEHAMDILRTDRGFRDDIGRTTMIRIFSVLGKGSDLAGAYRRRMFNFMH